MAPVKLQRALRRGLTERRNPERGKQQQTYMKSTMPYAGLAAPELRQFVRELCREYECEDAQAWLACILKLWREARVREERYAALEILSLARYKKAWLAPEHMELHRELITTGAWWDFVDTIAINSVGALLRDHPTDIKPLIYAWAIDEDLWIRRTSILAQLKFKGATDESLLFYAIEQSADNKDFFAKKAIGWALREYSKTQHATVIDYVESQREHLSALSIREGLRVVKKQGLV
jgi:3-methyladenine DNA glycosylase AlkD